jgi:two-component system OmpR family response regulator
MCLPLDFGRSRRHSRAVKILLVEDEMKIADFARKGLEAAGFIVDHAAHGDDAYHMATGGGYDAIVLDIMLPGRDGLSILRQLRERQITVPVILLTARSELNERLDGLNQGADDYLTKPFYVEELIARVHAIARRSGGNELSVLKAGDLSVNLITREVRRGEEAVELTTREFALLTYLMRSPGRVYSRTQIHEHVWNYGFDPGTNLVDVYIQRVRRKIGDSGRDSLIETVRGVGYRMRKTK